MEARRLKFAFLTGTLKEHTSKRRQRIVEKFKRGDIDVLISTGILDEGFDAPDTRFLILAGGGKAEHRQVQRIGRGMRAAEGKRELTVIDFMDRGYYLGKHSAGRLEAYKQEPAFSVTELTADELQAMLG